MSEDVQDQSKPLDAEPTQDDDDASGASTNTDVDAEADEIRNGPIGRLDVAVVLLRGIAVLFTVSHVPALLAIPMTLGRDEWESRDLLMALPSVVYLILSAMLWLFAGSIAGWMTGDVPEVEPAGRRRVMSSQRAQAIGFSFIGVLTILFSFRLGAQILQQLVESPGEDSAVRSATPFLRSLVIQFVFELVLGLWLFFGSRGLAGLWHRVRRRQ